MARGACRWHSESFSFQPTRYTNYVAPTKESWGLPVDPVPVSNDPPDDAYAMIPITAGLDEDRGRRLQQPGHRREGHSLPGHPRPQGLDGLQARMDPPGSNQALDHDL